MNKRRPPLVQIDVGTPLQDYYRDRDGNLYGVARIVDAAKGLPVFDAPLAGLRLSAVIWDGANMQTLAAHVKWVNESNLKYPIILDWYGEIADGRHRVIKALIEGKRTIKAVRLQYKLGPCREGEAV